MKKETKPIKIKINKISIKEEKLTKTGKKYCPVGILVAEDCESEFAGKWINTAIWEYKDPKDAKKNKSAVSKAEYFKTQSEGQDKWFEMSEDDVENGLTGEVKHYVNFSPMSKTKVEALETALKIVGNK